ncbi:response regulator [Persicimonas caeni]|uniref:histidine kinase n=1 Tax=Persicimonas caeni TaxID=2292766 RepID=A0A4Y6PY63_PERCE|nr:ATP-binding protein [Persicimonas caeni]QDG53099.1 response regulator [Persicimonas caeni]QED34321.1 response regulator [Persicimonas caeni]
MDRSSDSSGSDEPRSFLVGGGEMAELIAQKDWSETPLGPISQWPTTLKNAVSLCLASTFPATVMWGEELVYVYNDAYRAILGPAKHPQALGRTQHENFPEIRDFTEPLFNRIWRTGEGELYEDLLVLLQREEGFAEEVYVTADHAPIHDPSGERVGIFHALLETTGAVVGARRLETLSALGEQTSQAGGVAEVCEVATEVLADNRQDVPFALLYLVDEAQTAASLQATLGVEAGSAAAPRRISFDARDDPWHIARAVDERATQHLDTTDYAALPDEPWSEAPNEALALPISSASGDSIGAVLVAGVSPRRRLSNQYRDFFELVARQLGTAIASAHALEEERKRAEMLAELHRAKNTFFSNISHEFRTPLTLMLGPLEDALNDAQAPLPDAQRDRVDLARRNAERLRKLANTLLDFSRIEAGRVEAQFEPTDLGAFTADLASSFRSAVEKAGLYLEVAYPDDGEPAWVDRRMWEKIVLNLLSNAVKFTFEGGIEVELGCEEGRWTLEVRDTGTGIPAGEVPRLFERFHQVQGAQSRTHEGSGIGLSLVAELAKLHGGRVEVESEEGQGSTFRVVLPAGKEHLPAEQVASEPDVAPVHGETTDEIARQFTEEAELWSRTDEREAPGEVASEPLEAILVVDDNPDMRRYIANLLRPHWPVLTAGDGEEALRLIDEAPPALVLSDVMMPKMDGFELLARLREHPMLAQTPVILLSARSGEESVVEGLERGADDYLEKPFSAAELLARVRTHLELSQLRRDFEAEREASRARDEFMQLVAHELRTPLSSLRLQHELLDELSSRDDLADLPPKMLQKVASRAGTQVERISKRVQDLLDMSSIVHRGLELDRAETDLAALAAEVVASFELEARQAGSELTLDAPEPVVGDWDADRLDQVLTNLIDNALTYGEGEPVRVQVTQEQGEAVVRVIDRGIGVSQADQDLIFERFGRAVPTEHYGGLGLGLYISCEIAQAHDGTIEVDSAEGEGSTFTVRLPND